MHILLSRSWRHRLFATHLAGGAVVLGAGVALLTWSGGRPGGAAQVIAVLAGHLALLLAVVVVRRHWRRRTGGADNAV